jgi:hypothetical protein
MTHDLLAIPPVTTRVGHLHAPGSRVDLGFFPECLDQLRQFRLVDAISGRCKAMKLSSLRLLRPKANSGSGSRDRTCRPDVGEQQRAPDARIGAVLDWIEAEMLDASYAWRDPRLILFTESDAFAIVHAGVSATVRRGTCEEELGQEAGGPVHRFACVRDRSHAGCPNSSENERRIAYPRSTRVAATLSGRRKGIRTRPRPSVFEPRVVGAGKQLAGREEMVDLLESFGPAESGALRDMVRPEISRMVEPRGAEHFGQC